MKKSKFKIQKPGWSFITLVFAQLVFGLIEFTLGCIYTLHWTQNIPLGTGFRAFWHCFDDRFHL
jgi:hypothetical protein